MKYTARINKLIANKAITAEQLLSLQVGLERDAENLAMTPACVRTMALLEVQQQDAAHFQALRERLAKIEGEEKPVRRVRARTISLKGK